MGSTSNEKEKEERMKENCKKILNIANEKRSLIYRKLNDWESKKFSKVMFLLRNGMWPMKRVSSHYQNLGTFQHVTFKLPALCYWGMTEGIPYDLIKRIQILINELAGKDYKPAYRLVGEFQCRSNIHHPLHFHAALSIHRFYLGDKEHIKDYIKKINDQDAIHPDGGVYHLFRHTPLIIRGRLKRVLSRKWKATVNSMLEINQPYDEKLIHVRHCENKIETQTSVDRDRLGCYHAAPLKTLMRKLEFKYRPSKHDVEITYESGKTFRISVPDFIKRYVLLPLDTSFRARLCGALHPNSPFSKILAYASQYGILNYRLEFFDFLSQGMTPDEALMKVNQMFSNEARRTY